MKTINYTEIIDYLNENNIQFELHNKEQVKNDYTIASLFSPINNGCYFFTGSDFKYKINDSLIFSSRLIDTTANTVVVVPNVDIQLLFYRLLQFFYRQRSTGVIDDFTKIDKDAKIGTNVQIGAFTVIENCTIGNNVIIGSNCRIHKNVIIRDNTIIESGSIIGTRGIAWVWNEDQTEKVSQPQLGGVLIENGCFLGANTIIVRGSLNENTSLGSHSIFAPGCRLGHGTQIGKLVHFANNVVTGGNVKIGDNSFIGSGVVFRPKVHIMANTVVGAGAVVIKNTTKKGLTLMGTPALEFNSKNELAGVPKSTK